MLNENIWLIILPVLLFIFKDFFPVFCERVFLKHSLSGLWAKMVDKLLQFPVDLLFIAISYTVPKVIEITSKLSLISIENMIDAQKLINNYSIEIKNYYIRCGIMFVILPFLVIFTKYAVLLGDDENKRKQQVLLTFFHYIISIAAVIYSLFLY